MPFPDDLPADEPALPSQQELDAGVDDRADDEDYDLWYDEDEDDNNWCD